MVEVRPIRPNEWERFRELRLRALKDEPLAFGSTVGAEALVGLDVWKRWVAERPDRQVFVAEQNGMFVGLVNVVPAENRHDAFNMFGLWVDSGVRRQGIGKRLVGAAVEWAKATPRSRMRIHVHDANAPALALLEAAGFKDTGQRLSLREDVPGDARILEIVVG